VPASISDELSLGEASRVPIAAFSYSSVSIEQFFHEASRADRRVKMSYDAWVCCATIPRDPMQKFNEIDQL
jgi:hypothetical protein